MHAETEVNTDMVTFIIGFFLGVNTVGIAYMVWYVTHEEKEDGSGN